MATGLTVLLINILRLISNRKEGTRVSRHMRLLVDDNIEITDAIAFHCGLELGKFAVKECSHSKERLLGREMALNQTYIFRSD